MQRKRATRFHNKHPANFWETANTQKFLKENFSDDFEIGTLKDKLAGRPRYKGAESLTDTQLIHTVQKISKCRSLPQFETRFLDLALKSEAENKALHKVLKEGLRQIVAKNTNS